MLYGVNCSHNGKLSCSGRRGFYLDSCKNWRSDYFHSWESFPCGFFGSLYVWCCNQLLHSYQKFIIFIFAALLFSFPVYAEDERYEFQSIQNETLYLQGYNLNQYYNSLNNDELLALNPDDPSINTYSDNYKFYLLDFYAKLDNNNNITGKISYSGDMPLSVAIYRKTDNIAYGWTAFGSNYIYDDYIIRPTSSNSDIYYLSGIKLRYDNDVEKQILFDEIVIQRSLLSNDYQNIFSFIGGKMTAYLEQVATVFTWILTHITELITFILGNPFLAVSLVLFMCGAVISFYVRIKNS